MVFLTGTFTGMVLALQSGMTLDQFGARPVVGRLVSASMVKELGPVLTALMVTGRVGSGIAAELGSMMVTDQIAALRALGTDPIRKLVVPRVIAGTVMVPILTIIADAVGMFGGAIISKFQLNVAYSVYWNNVVAGLVAEDLWMGLIKPVVLGFTLVSIGCHVGLRAKGGTQGVGRATTHGRGRRVGRRAGTRFLFDEVADYADVLTDGDIVPRPPLAARADIRASGRQQHGRRGVRPGVAGVRRQSDSRRHQLRAPARAHEDHPRRERRGEVDDPEADSRTAEAGWRPDHRPRPRSSRDG